MSGPEPPHTEARVSSSNHRTVQLTFHPTTSSTFMIGRSPAGSVPCAAMQYIAEPEITKLKYHM